MTEDEARSFAADWIEAWNSHDLDRIMTHYAEDLVLVSPIAAQLLNDPAGMVRGKDSLREYFQKGLNAFPQLRFDLIEVMRGLSSIVLYYKNQRGTKSGEFMELNPQRKITRVVANYSA
ncbi:MAG: nuclear transport factor 2 family protein [Acidobacteria bacterium]|nr:MAG: nuclear transport factor 2 family protein [Acidobacteriota bacterium]